MNAWLTPDRLAELRRASRWAPPYDTVYSQEARKAIVELLAHEAAQQKEIDRLITDKNELIVEYSQFIEDQRVERSKLAAQVVALRKVLVDIRRWYTGEPQWVKDVDVLLSDTDPQQPQQEPQP